MTLAQALVRHALYISLTRWHSYATLAAPAAVPPTLDRAACLAAAAALLRQIDADGDGGADVREIEARALPPLSLPLISA